MGDPKSQRRKYTKPTHPWQGDRIEGEDEYIRKYGLKNKREFWKAESFLRDQRAQARSYLPLVLRDDEQGKKEADQLVGKLHRLGILDKDASLDDVLALDVDAILSRRLQTLTYLKGLANTPSQARQFITHGHVAIGDRRVTVPGKIVERAEEQGIQYAPGSPLNNPAHPLRTGEADVEEIPGGPGTDDEDVDEADEAPEGETDEEDEDETPDEGEDAEEPEDETPDEAEDATDEEDEDVEEADEAPEDVDEADQPEDETDEEEAAEEAAEDAADDQEEDGS